MQNFLHERYASAEMGRIVSPARRYTTWRRLWVLLAECQQELGLSISDEQLTRLRAVEDQIDLARVAEIERETRHDVVAHLRHFAEQAGEAGGVLHLGATSAFITDNTDLILQRQALELLERRCAAVVAALADFAEHNKAIPTLAYTHLQPAQLTTVGKRACLWLQDWLFDLEALVRQRTNLRCRGAKGTTGTQASYLTLFEGDHGRVRRLDELLAEKLGFAGSFPVTGQTYSRKQDTRVLQSLAGVAETAHKFGTDLRLLQGFGELAEPFGSQQVGSSAMAYKRNPIRSERLCGLARRLITDSLNGPLTAATQWLERSLDDSANRRIVLTDAYLTADAITSLAAGLADGLTVRETAIASRVKRELPFMATETLLMAASREGGDRQLLHERIRQYSMDAYQALERDEENPLIERIASDPDFQLSPRQIESLLDPRVFTGRAEQQVNEFLAEVVRPALANAEPLAPTEPRV